MLHSGWKWISLFLLICVWIVLGVSAVLVVVCTIRGRSYCFVVHRC